MGLRKKCLLLFLFSLLFFCAGCGGGDNPEGNRQAQKEMPRAIPEMENGLLIILQQADLIPVTTRLSEQGQPAQSDLELLTFEETLLGELLQREMEAEGGEKQKPPKNTEIVWDTIKEKITELHSLWNELQPLLMEENIPQTEIVNFEEGLDNLTVLGTEQDYIGTMTTANRLAGHLAKFMLPFTETKVSLAYELKYHVRNIVLQAALNDYARAQESLNYLEEQSPALANKLDEEEFNALKASVDDLQRVLLKQNIELVILNSAIVMENMVQAIEKISNSTA